MEAPEVRVGEQPRRPGPAPLLLVLAVAAIAGGLLAVIDPPSGLVPPTTVPSSEPAGEIEFAAWPPFVITWLVAGGAGAEGGCEPVGVDPCFARLAWAGYGRWAISYSTDRRFGIDDPVELEWQDVRYLVSQGEVSTVGRLPPAAPMVVCSSFLEAARRGEVAAEPGEAAGRRWLTFSVPAGPSARCLEEFGIPLVFSEGPWTWSWDTLSFRPPTPLELGDQLVRAEALGVPSSCAERPGRAFSDSPAGRWLAELAAAAGYPTVPAGSAVMLTSEILGLPRAVVVWVEADRPEAVSGMRVARVPGGPTVHESGEPLAVTTAQGSIRMWITLPQPISPHRPVLERANSDLRRVALDLYEASLAFPYRGTPPSGRGGFLVDPVYPRLGSSRLPESLGAREVGIGVVVETERWRVEAVPLSEPPESQFYRPLAPLPDGSPAWSLTVDPEHLLALAGGATLRAAPRHPDTSDEEVRAPLSLLAQAANSCPWLGMPAQDD